MRGYQYYYYPFKTANDATLKMVREKYQQKWNAVALPPGDKLLPTLDIRATLLVDGHSNVDSLEICARNGGTSSNPEYEVIGVADLAARLANLPQQFVAIRMLACHGRTFARHLAMALGTTHAGIHVGGYSKSVFHVPGMRAVTDPDGPNTTGSGLVRWFNAQGQAVQKPARLRWNEGDQGAPFEKYDPLDPT